MKNPTTNATKERLRDLELAMAGIDAAEEALRKAAELAERVQANAQQVELMLRCFELGRASCGQPRKR